MNQPTSLFDYHLPSERIAQHSVQPRDQSRLLVLDRKTGERQYKQFFEIVDELRSGDLLVMNDTKVFCARLKTTEGVEVFLLRAKSETIWETLMRPGKKVRASDEIVVGVGVDVLKGVIIEKREDGVVLVDFDRSPDEVVEFANAHGEIPTPPYVSEHIDDINKYQTVYAKETGSVAAPTAGFHFTPELIQSLKEKGIEFAFITLHVGIGTFRPMKTETIEEHEMHSEFVSISEETAQLINLAKKEGRRVIAVGTTTVRTLEGVAKLTSATPLNPPLERGETIRAYSEDVNIFITPGFEFRVIDGLITNFHLPKSTLLVLVSAFAGRESILSAYQEAIQKEYRFFSFGDAMFIT